MKPIFFILVGILSSTSLAKTNCVKYSRSAQKQANLCSAMSVWRHLNEQLKREERRFSTKINKILRIRICERNGNYFYRLSALHRVPGKTYVAVKMHDYDTNDCNNL